ncbi:MAG: DUF92 domain-containing protein [Cyclobacteriaceae bacterium]|nr:DUF92 domain-containing protein [Cyclobacteriaceae bacterium]
MYNLEIYLFSATIILAMLISYRLKKTNFSGTLVGGISAFLLLAGGGWPALLALFVFFVSGTMATRWKSKLKQQWFTHEKNEGGRSWQHVLCNAGAAVCCAIAAMLIPEHTALFMVMLFSSLAAACSDTLSSELGSIYGKKFFVFPGFGKGIRGQDGVVSLEGFGFGIIGSLMIALIYPLFVREGITWFMIIFVSGFAGNLIDSLAGTWLQQKNYLNNHAVNALATFFTALLAGLFCLVI